MRKDFIVKLKWKGDKRARMLRPDLGTTTRKIYASLMTEDQAQRVVAEVMAENADVIEWARAEAL
jgi:hypothetical protein